MATRIWIFSKFIQKVYIISSDFIQKVCIFLEKVCIFETQISKKRHTIPIQINLENAKMTSSPFESKTSMLRWATLSQPLAVLDMP